ncbi:hypothetical protein V2I01_20930 [Micromonospora sp. BRA006-A]|nr:hypothetical protein [Micromonospora sp. BRA006-A]
MTVPPLIPGPQEVWVYTRDDTHLPRYATVNVLADGSGTAVVVLTPAANVVSRVVDAATGAPVAGACVTPAPAGTGEAPRQPGTVLLRRLRERPRRPGRGRLVEPVRPPRRRLGVRRAVGRRDRRHR